MKKCFVMIAMAVLTALLGGCKTHYMEQETPPGGPVPPQHQETAGNGGQ